MMGRKYLLNFARTNLGSLLLRSLISRAPSIIPVDRIVENEALIAFHHPDPSYPTHIVLVPKAGYRNLRDMLDRDTQALVEVHETALEIVENLTLQDAGWRIIVNQGEFQDVGLLHFHLVAGELIAARP